MSAHNEVQASTDSPFGYKQRLNIDDLNNRVNTEINNDGRFQTSYPTKVVSEANNDDRF